jgi:quinol monooxygenase YgiN
MPVPQPTSIARWPAETPARSARSGERRIEYLPMNASYAAASTSNVTGATYPSRIRHDDWRCNVSELLGIARFKFREGKVEEYKRLADQAREIVRTKDSGTLQYDTYFNDDQSECVVIERYRDSEAAMEHAANVSDLFEPILATVTVVHGELLGEASAELRANLAGQDLPQLFTPYESM